MRSILLLRHAKSDWNGGSSDDHERPLNPRGTLAAGAIGRFLAKAGQLPDLVMTSSAVRARKTVELASLAGGWTCPIEATRSLYDASARQVLRMIRTLPEKQPVVLLAGHNPVWEDLAGLLIGGGRLRFPTAALARIDFAGTWDQVQEGHGTLAWLVTPKILENRKETIAD